MCCLVLRPFFDNCNRPNTHYIKQYGLFAWKYKQISSTKSNQLRMQYPFYDQNRLCLGQLGNYIPCLGQRGKNHTQSSSTSLYRSYKRAPPFPPWVVSFMMSSTVSSICWVSDCGMVGIGSFSSQTNTQVQTLYFTSAKSNSTLG